MKKGMFCFGLLCFLSSLVFAGAPTCYSSYGGYCQYTGKVKQIYINATNTILIYFDTPTTAQEASIDGITITNGAAAAFNAPDNPEFAKLFYSTALAAQASGREITMQMRGNLSGYLKFDRIWLAEP